MSVETHLGHLGLLLDRISTSILLVIWAGVRHTRKERSAEVSGVV